MKIAVTGAAGFIGRHVMAELSRRGIDATAIVRPRLQDSVTAVSERTVQLDLHAPPEDCYALMGRPDVLIHLAWDGLPNYQSKHHYETELPAQYRFLKALVRSGLMHLLVTGTCFEYGMQSGPLSVELEPKPSNPYGYAKDGLRRQLEYLQGEMVFSLVWARLFYLYGEGQSESSLFGQLKRAIHRGEKVFNMSGGEQLRDYLEASIAAQKIVSLALESRKSSTVNVCSGQPISVRRLVEGWIKDNGWSIELNFGHYPYPTHEPMAFWGDDGLPGKNRR